MPLTDMVEFCLQVTDGCRQRCASSILTSSCQLVYADNFDPIGGAGDPFDIIDVVTRNYREDDIEAVKLGGMVVKPLDMYDSRSVAQCHNLLELAESHSHLVQVLADA